MKILHLITTFSLGGATENTLLTVEGLKARGYDVWILAGPGNPSEGDLFDEAGAKGIRVDILPDLMRSIHPVRDLVALIKIIGVLRRERVDLVHTHSSKAGILGRVAAVVARTPIVVHTIHGLPFHEFQGRLMYELFRRAEQLCAFFTDRLVTVTDTIREKALAAGVGRQRQFTTVRSGFDMSPFPVDRRRCDELRREYGLDDTHLVVGKIARFSALKGHQYLIDVIPRVAASIPNVRFLLVGGGELEARFKEVVREKGIEQYVIFTGLMPVDRIAEFLSITDVVVHTSLLEGLARVLPQALAAGRPVISFDIDGAREVVLEGITGHLIEPMNEDQLSERLIGLLQDPGKRRAFGAAGMRVVREHWTTEAMVEGIDRVYRELFTSRGVSGPTDAV